MPDPAPLVARARELGLCVGIAFNPETEPEEVAPTAGDVDLVLCMGVHPGYSGQAYIPETTDRVRRLRIAIPCGGGAGNRAAPQVCPQSFESALVDSLADQRFEFLLKPFFKLNHDWVMRRGEAGLRREVARRTNGAALPDPASP